MVGPEKEPRNKELPIRPLDNHLLDVLSNTPQNGFRTHRQKMWVVIKARKKRDPNFRWPNPENNTEEEDKRIERELESEVAGLQRRIDDKVEKLVQKHFKGMMKGRSQTLKDTQETRDVQSKAMQQAFKELEVTEADKKEIQEWKDDMSEEDLEGWEKLEKDAEEVAYIKYRPSYTDEEGRTFFASFDTRTSEGGKVTSWNDPFWVGSWLSVIFYRLCIRMKNSWLHVPAGDVCLDVAPVEFMTPIPTKYVQGRSRLCLIKSLASALHYMGLKTEASKMITVSDAFLELEMKMAYKAVRTHMHEHAKCIGIATPLVAPRSFGARKKTKRLRVYSLEELIADKCLFPTLVVPRGADKGVGHAVCVVDDLIFDSTQARALKLEKSSFDWICGEGGCTGIYWALRFENPVGKEYKMERKGVVNWM